MCVNIDVSVSYIGKWAVLFLVSHEIVTLLYPYFNIVFVAWCAASKIKKQNSNS